MSALSLILSSKAQSQNEKKAISLTEIALTCILLSTLCVCSYAVVFERTGRLSALLWNWSNAWSPKRERKEAETTHNPAPLSQPSSKNEMLIGREFLTMGVSLDVLKNLPVDPQADFQEVCKEIKKRTEMTKGNRSLASHLAQDPKTKHLVGKADYFVSYAWKGEFGATMNALTKHFEGKPVPFVWMDVAMVDQHSAATIDLDFEDWSKTFKESLQQIGKALLVLTPGHEPIAITRSWCCFEWVCIKQANIPFEYCVNPTDVEQLLEFMESGMGTADFNDLFAGINVEKATAWKQNDQDAILELMRNLGVKEVNDVILFSLKDWLLQVAAQGEKHAKKGTKEGTYLLNAKAALHKALVRFVLSKIPSTDTRMHRVNSIKHYLGMSQLWKVQ